MTVVAVTGTSGKTTTTWLLEAIFVAAGHATGVIGTIEYRWGGSQKAASLTTPDAVELQDHAVGTMLPDHTPKPLGERAAVTGTSRRLGNFDSQKKPLRPALHSDPPSVPGRMAGVRKRGSLLSNWLSPHRVIMR